MSNHQRKGEQPLYAAAAPFAQEISRWLEDHHRRHGDRSGFRLKSTKPGNRYDPGTGLEQLAARSGIPTKSLREYRNGNRLLITLHNADRLAMALDTPLWCIAEEFLPRGEALARWGHEQVTA